MDPAALLTLREDPEKLGEIVRCAESFRHFLRHWHFRSIELGEVRILGDVLWPAQEAAAGVMEETARAFFLKARKLGETTLECAFDGWVARFRDRNAVFYRRRRQPRLAVRRRFRRWRCGRTARQRRRGRFPRRR